MFINLQTKMIVVINRFVYETFYRDKGKPKKSLSQYPFLSLFFTKKDPKQFLSVLIKPLDLL